MFSSVFFGSTYFPFSLGIHCLFSLSQRPFVFFVFVSVSLRLSLVIIRCLTAA